MIPIDLNNYSTKYETIDCCYSNDYDYHCTDVTCVPCKHGIPQRQDMVSTWGDLYIDDTDKIIVNFLKIMNYIFCSSRRVPRQKI